MAGKTERNYDCWSVVVACFIALALLAWMFFTTTTTSDAKPSPAKAQSDQSNSVFDYPEMDFTKFFPDPPLSFDQSSGVINIVDFDDGAQFSIQIFNDTPLLIDVQQLGAMVKQIRDLLAEDRPALNLRHPEKFIFLFSKEKYVIPFAFYNLAAQGEREFSQFFRSMFTSIEALAEVTVGLHAGTADGLAEIIPLDDGSEMAFVALAMGKQLASWHQQRQWTDGRRAYDPKLPFYNRARGRVIQHLNLVHELIHCWTIGCLPAGREDETMVYSLDDVYTQRFRPSILKLP
jgi:hypothetical protein